MALSVALGMALLVIAFLLGRESTRTAPAPDAAVPETLPTVPSSAPQPAPVPELDWEVPEATEAVATEAPAAGPAVGGAPVERVERRKDGTLVLTNAPEGERSGLASDPPNDDNRAEPSSETRQAVTAYFERMDVIRSEEGAGDPNVFAMGLIKSGLGGATSGFDRLIDDTERMEKEIRSVVPPTMCQGYHEASLEALVESRAMLESLSAAIGARDIGQLGQIARQASLLQEKTEALQRMRDEIRASTQQD